MILYFTGTGNSAAAADIIAEKTGDSLISLNKRIKENDISELNSETPFVVCAPTYAWRIPHIVEKHLNKTVLKGSKKIYFVMTCGDENGNADKYLKRFCAAKELEYMGCTEIKMPENYIAMFDSPSDEKAKSIIEKAIPDINAAAELIIAGKGLPEKKPGVTDKLKSGIVNTLFYSLCVKADSFRATEKCISCGKCEKICPLNSIKITDGKPEWGKNCTHCMACIARCPAEAIEYGKKSVGQNRYVFPGK